jgi:FAD-linked sulfhydryl oxidase
MGWLTLHSIAANYPEHPTNEDRLILKRFMDLFTETIACPTCKNHFGSLFHSYINQFPSWANSRFDLFVFVCRAHNAVNLRLDKPRISSVSESINTLKNIVKIVPAATYRQNYLIYLRQNWSREIGAEGFMNSRAVREMVKINQEYWDPRETNFEISLPEVDVLKPFLTSRTARGTLVPGLTSTGTPVSVGFKMRGGKFSLIGR